MSQSESLTKAAHDADFLVSDLLEAYSDACRSNPMLAILLLELIGQAQKITLRFAEIQIALKP